MTLNKGYSYSEQLGPRAAVHTTLSYLVARYTHSDETIWQQRLLSGEVLIDGATASGEEALRTGQILVWNRPPWQEEAVPRFYELIYEDKGLLAVNKPSGLPTLPAGGFLENTLLSLVRETYPEANPLHRLGRGTSGLVLFARETGAARALTKVWKSGVRKSYRALSMGRAAKDYYKITATIGPVAHPKLGSVFSASRVGKTALSVARVLERRTETTEVTVFDLDLITGRPHQIRIHLAYIGHPLVGDPLYAEGAELLPAPGLPGDGGYFLHAEKLSFVHPGTGEWLELCASVPAALEVAKI